MTAVKKETYPLALFLSSFICSLDICMYVYVYAYAYICIVFRTIDKKITTEES